MEKKNKGLWHRQGPVWTRHAGRGWREPGAGGRTPRGLASPPPHSRFSRPLDQSALSSPTPPTSFIHPADFGSVYYGANHPMKPHRLAMTHSLVLAYGLHEGMEVYVSG
jgi:hypothetical protein